ncbi:MAG: DUF4845 domain-containing protein [Methylococcaceae bacterium]|nr:DUF4845 domain-containing protein [Methylococcaceae bacterium]MDD1609466.1 DUF4845 domain-containing protein [Methylococcaceae bacterium]
MKASLKKQQGMTMISIICVAVVVISIFLLALNIVPIYMDHGKVVSALDALKNNPEVKGESPEQVSSRLFKILGINYIDDLVTKDNVTIGKEDNGGTKIHVEYEVVKKLVGNASILVQFDDTVIIK